MATDKLVRVTFRKGVQVFRKTVNHKIRIFENGAESSVRSALLRAGLRQSGDDFFDFLPSAHALGSIILPLRGLCPFALESYQVIGKDAEYSLVDTFLCRSLPYDNSGLALSHKNGVGLSI